MRVRDLVELPSELVQIENIRRWGRTWVSRDEQAPPRSEFRTDGAQCRLVLTPMVGTSAQTLLELLSVLTAGSGTAHRVSESVLIDDTHLRDETHRDRSTPAVSRSHVVWHATDRCPPRRNGAGAAALAALCHDPGAITRLRVAGVLYVWLAGYCMSVPGDEHEQPWAYVPVLRWEMRDGHSLGIVLDAIHRDMAPGAVCFALVGRHS